MRDTEYRRVREHLLAGGGFTLTMERKPSIPRALFAGACVAALAIGAVALGHGPALAGAPADPTLYLGAAGAWTFYNTAKKYMGSGPIDLDSSTFRMGLYTSASNAATATMSRKGSVTGEVTEANGYSSSGKALAGVTWTVGASASEYRFNCNALVWSATGGNIANAKFAVIFVAGASAGAHKLLCYSQLSTGQFTITTGNSLTVTPSANGVFELN